MNMQHLFRNMVVGLVLLSSTLVFAEGEVPAAPGDERPDVVGSHNPIDITEPAKLIDASVTPEAQDVHTQVENEAFALRKNVNDYVKNQETCKSREDKASYLCGSRNPDLKNYVVVAQVLMAGASGMADACGKFGKVMDAGNKALTAYQALCSSWRGLCLDSCGDAVKNIQDAQKNLELLVNKATAYASKQQTFYSTTNPAKSAGYAKVLTNYQQQKEKLEPNLKKELEQKGEYVSIAEKKATCDGFAKELAASSLGLLSMAKSFGQANNCEKNTTNTPVTNVATATGTPVDCTIAANKQNNMTCICLDAPRTPGCNTGLDNATVAKSASSLRAAGTSDYVPAKASAMPGVDGGGGGELNLASKSDGGGSSLPGAPMGGSAAGIDGGSSGSGGPPGSQGGGKASGLNTNILAGEGGGGGGGGWGGDYGSEDEKRSLRQYLPGGAKDPTALAGQTAANKEVTSQGGKSNWEKVRERYRDNKPSLLGY